MLVGLALMVAGILLPLFVISPSLINDSIVTGSIVAGMVLFVEGIVTHFLGDKNA